MTGILAALAGGVPGLKTLSGTTTLTNGFYNGGAYVPSVYGYGPSLGGSIGSMSPNPLGGTTITEFQWDTNGNFTLAAGMNGVNNGWTQFTVNGTTFTRTSATYAIGSYGDTWTWVTGTNPISGSAGTNYTVVFT